MMRFLGFSVVILLLVSGFSGCSGEKQEARNLEQIYRQEGIPVRVQEVKAGEFEVRAAFNSVLTGIKEASAYAPVDDEVEKVYVKVGDYVKKDQTLLTFPMDNPSARYYQAKVAFENAQTAFLRIQNLYKSGGISLQERDNARAAYEVARANWDAVKQAVKARAPISGYVTRVNVRETDKADRDQELVTISRTDKMKARVWVSEKEIGDVEVGQPAFAAWQDFRIPGRVVQVDMAMNQETQAFGAVIEFENPDNRLRAGTTVTVTITTYRNPQAVAVSRENVWEEEGRFFVYVVEDNRAAKREVHLGRRQALGVEIRRGLNPGDRLVVEGQMLLEDGSKVKVLEP